MSQPHYGGSMDRPAPTAGSVKRARERAQAGQAPPRPPREPMKDDFSPQGQLSPPPRRHMPPPHPPPPLPSSALSGRPRPPQGLEGKGGAPIISRPTQIPNWPLPPGSPLTPKTNEQYQPPPGRPTQAPPRPARPSRIPSMLDQSRLQEPTPVFFNPQVAPDENREPSQENNPLTPATASSRLTSSSVGTIPEFPSPGTGSVPAVPAIPAIPSRKSASLGPPPSARRGASSFYSSASYVSPIPEESSRSHGSYASSAAMPESWGPTSPASASSPYQADAFYDDTNSERSRGSAMEDFNDESKLVRSASIGKKGKAALVDNKPTAASAQARPSPRPVQNSFQSGTAYMDATTSSSEETLGASRQAAQAKERTLLSPMGMLRVPGSPGPGTAPSPQPSPSRLSAIRRPPKLDIDAVRAAEARGSMTSLPDLIKRATRLAAMIERGKRPASRFDNFNDLLFEKSGAYDGEKDDSSNDRHQSGLSDMLAAFPPPGQPTPNERPSRGSWFRTTSWPLIPGKQGAQRQQGAEPRAPTESPDSDDSKPKTARRCCGMPPWLFVLVMILILCIIATAIVIPLQFFVFKTLGNHEEPQSSLDQCQSDLNCQNGGTNVMSQGTCSCICTNGFSGRDCSVQGDEGCTTTNLVSTDSDANIENVTLGKAIPRLIADANSNFSIPLSGTAILAKVNNGDISCQEQNSLVTFNGRLARFNVANAEVEDVTGELQDVDVNAAANAAALIPIKTLTIEPGDSVTVTIPNGNYGMGMPTGGDNAPSATPEPSTTKSSTPPRSTTESSADNEPSQGAGGNGGNGFSVTEEVLDFARVAVLFILQEQESDDAETAQTRLQEFFSGTSLTNTSASNIAVGGDNIVDLVDFRVNVGDGFVGMKNVKRSIFGTWSSDTIDEQTPPRRGGSVLSKV